MTTRLARHIGWLFLTFVFMFAIAACGGGGGDSSDDCAPGFLRNDCNGNGNGNGNGNAPAEYTLALTLRDAEGNPTRTVTSASPANLEVLVTRGSEPVADLLVRVDTQYAVILPEGKTALTNGSGIAKFELRAGDTFGADRLTATITPGDEAFEGRINYQVDSIPLRLGHFKDDTFVEGVIDIRPANLSTGGSALLSIAVVDSAGEPVQTKETILLSSPCADTGEANLPESTATSTGHISATYQAEGCIGNDQITARLESSASSTESAVAHGTVNVASPEANSIKFISTIPEVIALKGTGGSGRQETADVKFQVIDGQGRSVQGLRVDFQLSTEVGGLSLAQDSQISDREGFVTAVVQSGKVATPIRVIASIKLSNGDERSTISDKLAVSSGLPDANSISLSIDKFAVGAADVDGVEAVVTVRLADKFNNPVADGTSASFTTEYGAIDGSCTTTDGACSVVWRSQSPRFPTYDQNRIKTIDGPDYHCDAHNGKRGPCPVHANAPHALGAIHGLRSTITVLVIGEESFHDANNNGVYDKGESFENLPEAFFDHNEDGVYTPILKPSERGPNCLAPSSPQDCFAAGASEYPANYDGNGVYDLHDDPALFNGLSCPEEGDGVYCSRDQQFISDDVVIIMSHSSSYDMLLTTVPLGETGKGEVSNTVKEGADYYTYISDRYNNRPPSGSTISISTEGDCALLSKGEFTVGNTNKFGAYGGPGERVPILIEGDGGLGSLDVTVSTPSGGESIKTFQCVTTPPPPDDDDSAQS